MRVYPFVSIVIISHNEEKNIGDCLKSVISLDYPKEKVEVIVVDSSNDRTGDIVRLFENVRLITSNSKGFSAKRNLGYRSASYDLIAFLDADCIAPPEWLSKMLPRIMLPEVAAVGCNAYPPPDVPFFGKCIACLGKPAGGAIGFDSEVTFLDRGVNYIGSGCSIFKKKILEQVGGFNERLPYGSEDVEISERIRNAHYILEYNSDAFVYHKTRNTLKQFIRWAFRRGMSHFYTNNPDLAKIFFEPFSPFWLIILAFALVLLPIKYILPLIALGLIFSALFLVQLVHGKFHWLFPTGRKKLRLLFERRRSIGVNIGTILFFIIPLFYMDRFIINLAQLYCKISSFWKMERKEV